MEAQRGENSVTELCRKHGISQANLKELLTTITKDDIDFVKKS